MKIVEAKPPLADLADAIGKAQAQIYRYSGRRGITRVSITSELGLAQGLVPGTCAILWTSCGPVEIYCERRLDFEYERCNGFYDDGVMPTRCQNREGCGRVGCPAADFGVTPA